MIVNYLMIGFGFAFLLDLMTHIFRNHEAWKDVPHWDWKARIAFVLFWPVGISIFLYTFIKSYLK